MEPLPASRPSGSSGARISRIGNWGGTGGRYVSYRIATFINISFAAAVGVASLLMILNHDSDDDGDEAQNYFAGGERRYVSSDPRTLSLSPRVLSPQRDKCPESGQEPDSSSLGLMRDLLPRALSDGTLDPELDGSWWSIIFAGGGSTYVPGERPNQRWSCPSSLFLKYSRRQHS